MVLANVADAGELARLMDPEAVDFFRGGDGTLYSVEDLPLAVRSELPKVDFTGHLYSADPAARMIIVDGSRTLTEGQLVGDDLFLEEITNDGVIMVFRGYRFSAGVVGDWALR